MSGHMGPLKAHELSSIRRVVGVVSGKGGVGKSLITAMLAVSMNRLGNATAILDADITGPSCARMFGVTDRRQAMMLGFSDPKHDGHQVECL